MNVRLTITPQSKAEFDRTLKQYLEYSSLTLPQVLNEKAYFITTKAIYKTHKASKEEIGALMGAKYRTTWKRNANRKLKQAKVIWGTSGKYWNLLGVKIILARLRKKGQKIPDKKELLDMAKKMVAARLRSIAFLRSGWIPAMKKFARFSKYGRIKFGLEDSGKQYGTAKGGGTAATKTSGLNAKVIFWNQAIAKRDHKDALNRYGTAGLEAAFQEETASMKEYIERKMKEGARKLGIRVK